MGHPYRYLTTLGFGERTSNIHVSFHHKSPNATALAHKLLDQRYLHGFLNVASESSPP